MADIRFRFAQEEDCRLILKFIRSLARYEKMSDEVVATEEILREWLFVKKKAEVIFALDGEKEVGFALFFHNFTTLPDRAGIYPEDLFVFPELGSCFIPAHAVSSGCISLSFHSTSHHATASPASSSSTAVSDCMPPPERH